MKTINFGDISLIEFIKRFNTEKRCIRFLEEELWENGEPISPYDPTSKVYRRGDGMYRCKNTGKNFNIRIGTMFEGSKLPLVKWFYALYMITNHTKGISSVQLSKDIQVTQKTAWFLLQRIRQTFRQNPYEKFDGEVEVDETFVGGKNKNRHKDKKVKKCQGRSFKDKVPVMGIVQRGGKVFCKVVENTGWKELTPPILRKVKRTAVLYSDEWCGYQKVISKVYKHHIVDHGHGIYACGGAYTNTIEGFWGNYCKRAINGIYNHLSRKHMQLYFDEFCFRYNSNKVTIGERFCECIRKSKGVRITYQRLVA